MGVHTPILLAFTCTRLVDSAAFKQRYETLAVDGSGSLRREAVATFLSAESENSLIDKVCAPCEEKGASDKVKNEINLCSVCGKDSEYKALIDSGGVMCGEDATHARCELPQFPQKDRDGQAADPQRKTWEDDLTLDGIEIVSAQTPVKELMTLFRPSQKMINGCKTCGMARSAQKCFVSDNPSWPTEAECEARKKDGCFCAWTTGISVTEDGHILDGHHRWAATWLLLKDKEMPKPTESAEVDIYKRMAASDDQVTINRVLAVAKKLDGLEWHTKCESSALRGAESKVWSLIALLLSFSIWH